MKRTFLWIQLVLAALVVLGVCLQVYFIASYFFGAAGALDAHRVVGNVTNGLELLVFVAAIAAWWRTWGKVGHAFGLAVVGTIQISLTGADGWVGGFHGLLALAILVMALVIVKDDVEALGLRRSRSGAAGGGTPPPLP